MALYTFVGIFCSFIAVDITKFLISRKASGFLYLLNLLAVASLSIILANLLGFIWLMIYSELFITVWFPELYHFGQMFIAFFGSSIWMSIFFVPLFHYMHIKNKVQYKKWIYSAFLIIIIAIPLMTVVQNGKSDEDNLTSVNNESSKYDFENVNYICHTGLHDVFLGVSVHSDSGEIIMTGYSLTSNWTDELKYENKINYLFTQAYLKNDFKFKKNNQNKIKFASASDMNNETFIELEHVRENIFYEFSNEFMQTQGRCVEILMDASRKQWATDIKNLGLGGYTSRDNDIKYFEIAQFLKSQGVVNQ